MSGAPPCAELCAELPERPRDGQGPFSAVKGLGLCLEIQAGLSGKKSQEGNASSKCIDILIGGVRRRGGGGQGEQERKVLVAEYVNVHVCMCVHVGVCQKSVDSVCPRMVVLPVAVSGNAPAVSTGANSCA